MNLQSTGFFSRGGWIPRSAAIQPYKYNRSKWPFHTGGFRGSAKQPTTVCFLRVENAPEKKLKDFGFLKNIEDTYALGECIGVGSFSTIHEAVHKETGETFAVKTVQKNFKEDFLESHLVARVQHEVDIYAHLGASLNVAYLYGVYETDEHVQMVMELCSGGQLNDILHKKRNRGFGEAEAKNLIRQVLRSVAQCHAKNIVMRDVKPDNFMFSNTTSDSPLKAIDFGLADYCSKGDILWERCGTPLYIAPEVLRRKYGQESDLWSAGVVAYQILTGKLPFCGEDGFSLEDLARDAPKCTNKDIFRAVLYSDLDFKSKCWKRLPAAALDLVQGLLCRDEKKRLTAEEALAHPWMCEDTDTTPTDITDSCVQRLQRFGTYGQLKQAALRKIIEYASEETDLMTDLQEAFALMDPIGSGKLKKLDMVSLLKGNKFVLTEREVRQLIAQMKMENDGNIELLEWLAVMADWRLVQENPLWQDWVTRAFAWFDVDNRGKLDVGVLTTMLCGDYCTISDTVPAALREADLDGDGTVHLSEFAALVQTDRHDKLEIFGSRRRR